MKKILFTTILALFCGIGYFVNGYKVNINNTNILKLWKVIKYLPLKIVNESNVIQ